MKNYQLELLSESRRNKGSVFRAFDVNDEKIIGVHDGEPFSIKFRNNSFERIQVRLSLDGTDILTGEPASLAPYGKMWMVEPYGILHLKAWPESDEGGAQFVFTDAESGVATHIHGVKEGIGTIGAAIYTEGHVQQYLGPYTTVNPWPYDNRISSTGKQFDLTYGSNTLDNTDNFVYESHTVLTSDLKGCTRSRGLSSCVPSGADDGIDVRLISEESSRSLAIGAGSNVMQKISHSTGLVKPVLSETIQMKYEPWSVLKRKLERQVTVKTAFPGEKRVDLRGVPRVDTSDEKMSIPRFM